MNNIPLSLYIHIPWCVQKCPYCDFNSHQPVASHTNALSKNAFKNHLHSLPESQYIQQLLADLDSDRQRFCENRALTTIFIGGGTPSLFSGDAIARLLDGIRERLVVSAATEITLEANPGTADEANFSGYRRAGVNRLSVGVQSFNRKQLKQLGRIHSPDEAIRAVKTAQDVGFDNINIDLMFGLPEQTQDDALADVEQGIALGTEHLSYYQLTLEPNTVFARHPPTLPNEDTIDRRFAMASQRLIAAGFSRYEVSAWSRGRRAQHNINYWQHGDYLGIGAGAHGKVTRAERDGTQIIRTTKPRSPKAYLASPPKALPKARPKSPQPSSKPSAKTILPVSVPLRHERVVADDEKAVEFMLNALRLSNGFDRHLIRTRGLLDEAAVLPTLLQLSHRGLLELSDDRIVPTPLGQRFVNDMVEAFL